MARHVVVVESDLDLVVVYRALFVEAGYTLHWAKDIVTAQLLLRRARPPDVLILNGLVPHATLAFCREQRAAWPLMPIILTSTQPEDRAAALAAGADFFVVKPFYAEDLIARMIRLLPHEPSAGGRASDPGGATQA